MKPQHRKFFGFTLAEILVTLLIIGVIAAFTIPVLYQNYLKKQYVTSLKKFYTTASQALQNMAGDFGCVNDFKCTGLFSSTGTNSITLGVALSPYFNITKSCPSTNQGCWPDNTNNYYDGTGTNWQYDAANGYKFITTDGMSVFVGNYAIDCDTPTYSNGKTGNMTQVCGYLRVDVNGLKGPNCYGRDTFFFWITNGKGAVLYPLGGADDKYGGTDSWWSNSSGAAVRCYPSSKTGSYCTGRIMEEGWEMNY